MLNHCSHVVLEIFEGGQERTVYFDENGKIIGQGKSGIIKDDMKPVKVIKGKEAVMKYRWCQSWKELSEKDHILIWAVFNKDNLREHFKNNIEKLKTPRELLKTTEQFFYKRGWNKPCTRCGGTGNYSYNPIYNTMCFKCKGKKLQFVRPTKRELEKLMKQYPEGLIKVKDQIRGKGEYLIKNTSQ